MSFAALCNAGCQSKHADALPCTQARRADAVIKNFCKNIGADQKQIQGLIRLAKQNGGRLGFLA